MKEFKANPLGKGNSKLFPPRIEIHEDGVRFIQQGVFKCQDLFVRYSDIKDVKIETPMFGFATIRIWGGQFKYMDPISGFSNYEVRQMRDLIELGRKNPKNLIKELNDEDWEDEEEKEDGNIDDEELDEENDDFDDEEDDEKSRKQSKDDKVAPVKVSVAPPPPPTFSFYALIDNKQYGPYDRIQFKRLVDNNMVNKDTLVWKEGMAQWQAAKDVPDMDDFFPSNNNPTPPPPPPSPMGPPPPPVQ